LLDSLLQETEEVPEGMKSFSNIIRNFLSHSFTTNLAGT
jgi:hypothetical protein